MCSIQCQRSNTSGMLCTVISEGIECLMLLKITLKCLSLRMILDLLNQVVNVNTM